MKFGFSRTAQSSTVAGVLPGFLAGRIEPRRSRRWLFFGALTLVAFIYGCAVAIFPTLFYSIFAIPIIGLGLAALWALPDTNVDRGRAIRSLFWLYLVSLMLWPSYLAIALPGLPWINVQRLFLLPLCAIFFYSLSTSKVVRTELGEVLSANRFASTLFFSFVVLQFATTVLSPSIGASIVCGSSICDHRPFAVDRSVHQQVVYQPVRLDCALSHFLLDVPNGEAPSALVRCAAHSSVVDGDRGAC